MARRQALSVAEQRAASVQVIHHVNRMLAHLAGGNVVAGYLPHRQEMDPRPVLQHLQDRGLRIALPVLPEDEDTDIEDGGILAFRLWSVGDDAGLVPGRHGIPVPGCGRDVMPDAVMVPLVAFTRAGDRLGYGGGWYDRTLRFLCRMNPGLPRIGLAFACQQADVVPVDPWDVRLSVIVTEREVIPCPGYPVGAYSETHKYHHVAAQHAADTQEVSQA